MASGAKPVVALLVAPATSASVLFGLLDVLVSVGVAYPELVGEEAGEPLLDVMIVAADLAPFRCAGNILVEPHATFATIGCVDVAIASDIFMPIDQPPRGQYDQEIAWLQQVHASGALVSSVCSGSVLLAEAGLLDGRRCAGHWAYPWSATTTQLSFAACSNGRPD